jgi:hypothetical protein
VELYSEIKKQFRFPPRIALTEEEETRQGRTPAIAIIPTGGQYLVSLST